MSRRLETEQEKKVVVMFLGNESQVFNDNDYYLLSPSSIIRKENSTIDDPVYIVLLDENKKFKGIFKRLEGSSNPSCWDIVVNE